MRNLLIVLGTILFILLCFLFPFVIGYILTLLIIWVADGLFNYDLHDKFWYIYVVVVIIIPMLKGFFRVEINNK